MVFKGVSPNCDAAISEANKAWSEQKMIQDYQVATGDGGSRAGFEILPAKEGRIQAQF